MDTSSHLQTLTLEDTNKPFQVEAEPDSDYKVKFEGRFTHIEPGEQRLTVNWGSFADYTMPESIEQLWGPVNLPRLPPGVPNNCRVASHR